MNVLIAMGVFILSHIAISRTSIKPAFISHWGRGPYLLAFSLISIGLLGWVIWELLQAERIQFWTSPYWGYYFAALMTFISFVLIGAGALSANPLSIAFRRKGFDPSRPGIIGWVRHPIIWGLTLWALAHIPVNGDWPSLIVFIGSAGFGLLGLNRVERRYRVRIGPEQWTKMTAARGHVDKAAMLGGMLGIGFWCLFLLLHPVLFGVDPIAFF